MRRHGLGLGERDGLPAPDVPPPGRPGVSGPDHDRTISPTSLCGPEILGPHNNGLGLNSDWSLCGPRQNFVVLGLDNDQIKKLACGPRTGQ